MNINYLLATLLGGLLTMNVQAKPTVAAYGEYGNFETWAEHSDVKSNDWGTHHNSMLLEVGSNLGIKDIYLVDGGQLGVYINRFELMDLTDYFAPYKSDFYPYAVEQGIDTQGKQRALPLGIGVGVQFYRTDLMADAGVTVEQISGSWEQYLQAARTAKENGFYIVDNSYSILRLYIYSHLEDGEFLFSGADGEYNLHNEIYTQAYEYAKTLHDEELAYETGMWNSDWYGAYRGDKLLASVQGIWLAGHLYSWIAVEQKNKFFITQTPGEKSGNWGGAHIIVNKNADLQILKPILDSMIGQTDNTRYAAQFNEYKIESSRIDMLPNYDEGFYTSYFNQENINSVLKKSIQDMAIIRTHPLDQYAQELYFTKYYTMVMSEEITIADAIAEINQLLADRLADITIDEGV
ncbi:MAG: extracellular solute-binding protein [Saccharospirillaceae bacterium]|nr:extracellular solute-binding protein [Pseudomonadales bacterium]NRB77793.1 extracellular solute-binding protein [Saccharospirillaceae bacterium]